MIKTGLVWSSTSSVRPGTRANSPVLFVTSNASAAMACPRITGLFGPEAQKLISDWVTAQHRLLQSLPAAHVG